MGTRSSSTVATRQGFIVAKAEHLERYTALPLPTTKDEHWRFTDLAGFDPDSWTANGATEISSAPSMLELDVSGIARVGEAGIEIPFPTRTVYFGGDKAVEVGKR